MGRFYDFFDLEFLHRQQSISLFNCLIFSNHFAITLNSKKIFFFFFLGGGGVTLWWFARVCSQSNIFLHIVDMGQGDYNQGTSLLANLKTFGFIFTFLIIKNSLETFKPIAVKLQQKDQDVFEACSMIDDPLKAVHRVRSNRRRMP